MKYKRYLGSVVAPEELFPVRYAGYLIEKEFGRHGEKVPVGMRLYGRHAAGHSPCPAEKRASQ
jgi:hypothetical protein